MKITFLQGPFDGHQQEKPVAELNDLIYMPVSRNVFRYLDGQRETADGARVTSCALYQFETVDYQGIYRFMYSVDPRKVDFSSSQECRGK